MRGLPIHELWIKPLKLVGVVDIPARVWYKGDVTHFLQQQYLSSGWFSNDHYSISVFQRVEHTNTIMVITDHEPA